MWPEWIESASPGVPPKTSYCHRHWPDCLDTRVIFGVSWARQAPAHQAVHDSIVSVDPIRR